MAATTPHLRAILSKCVALIERARARVNQIDHNLFPTESSKDALSLLKSVLTHLSDPILMGPMDPVVLYNRLIRLQRLIEDLEASTCDRISWPLVSHCEQIWTDLFPNNGPKLFYSVTPKHNYQLKPFSSELATLLSPLLPSSVLIPLERRRLYCLYLASLEDANLPLYANIAHEFGHALYLANEQQIKKRVLHHLDSIFDSLIDRFQKTDQSEVHALVKLSSLALLFVSMELYADLVAALLLGPAFFLSLDEMSWGELRDSWILEFPPEAERIRAYPSVRFRLDSIKRWAGLSDFEAAFRATADTLSAADLRAIPAYIAGLRTDHANDDLTVVHRSERTGQTIKNVIKPIVPDIKAALIPFLEAEAQILRDAYPERMRAVPARDVVELLRRLESDILPNIVPDGSLRGHPASFQAIINAAAIYRQYVLLRGGVSPPNSQTALAVFKIERLTAKALEVSFVQHRYNEKIR